MAAGDNNKFRYYDDNADRPESDDNSWAISYGDMISVLLCFFVLLLSISVINPNKFEVIQNSINGAILDTTSIEELQKKVEELIRKENLQEVIKLDKNDLGIDIAIRDKVLFASGSAEINPNSAFIFEKLLGAFNELPEQYTFQIEGHTDDVPIQTELFPSNWYLSSYRALAVLDLFLLQNVDPSRLQVQGFAETRPEFPHRDKQGARIPKNQEFNRRVVIKVR